jgi:phosphoribosylformylglycinamidine synthase
MNFGNPTKPEVMGQFGGCITGMAEACRALDFPIVSGNVSLYNETEGRPIMPTPVIGGVGLLADVQGCVDIALREAGLALVLVGETKGHLGQSIYLREIHGREHGAPPPVDLAVERRNGDFVRGRIGAGHVAACHDLSDGGLLIALTEMAMAGATGATIKAPADIAPHAWLFGEDQGRYLLATNTPDAVLAVATKAGVPARKIGTSGGGALTVEGLMAISLSELRRAHETWLPTYMAGATA